MPELDRLDRRHVLFLSWRDTSNPEGGGAEIFLEHVAGGLVELGCQVTIFSAAHAGAPPDETVDGIRYIRRGSKLTVYLMGILALLRRQFGRVDLVVDIQNGMPFFSRLVTRKPVVVLVHHVHREQWPVLFTGLLGRIGWWIERRIAPVIYRRCQYVAVSRATRDELVELGVGADRIAVVHNGTAPEPHAMAVRALDPVIAVVGRLVPHKRVEHAIDAAVALRERHPGLRLHVVGSGWWEANLREYVAEHDAQDVVVFEGHVGEDRKHEIYGSAWVLALPSVKEGWGLVVSEAGVHGTPTVAYYEAGGTRESIAHNESGLLVHEPHEFDDAIARIINDPELRSRLGDGARKRTLRYTWAHTQESFGVVLAAALGGERLGLQDPAPTDQPAN